MTFFLFVHKILEMLIWCCLCCRNQRAKPIIIDPGLYLSKKSELATTSQRRSLPTAFTLFTGKFI